MSRGSQSVSTPGPRTLRLPVASRKKEASGGETLDSSAGIRGLEGLELNPTAAQAMGDLRELEVTERRSGPLSPSAIAQGARDPQGWLEGCSA
jgi:hypothetical protein